MKYFQGERSRLILKSGRKHLLRRRSKLMAGARRSLLMVGAVSDKDLRT